MAQARLLFRTEHSHLVVLICEVPHHDGQQVLGEGTGDGRPALLAEQCEVRHLLHQLCTHRGLWGDSSTVSGRVLSQQWALASGQLGPYVFALAPWSLHTSTQGNPAGVRRSPYHPKCLSLSVPLTVNVPDPHLHQQYDRRSHL